jgi:RimJ/RimL family protein N-acetyltransferase
MPKTTFPSTVTTDRLIADPCSVPRDLDGFAAILADQKVGDMMWPGDLGGTRTREETAAWLGKYEAHWAAVGFGPWTVRERDSGAMVGHVGLSYTVVSGRAEVEVGWILGSAFWGKGYATEITKASLAHAHGIRGLTSVVGFTLQDHKRAQRTFELSGFTYEGETTVVDLPHFLYRHPVG